jgi:hypothetical protein
MIASDHLVESADDREADQRPPRTNSNHDFRLTHLLHQAKGIAPEGAPACFARASASSS